jgi:hypothetical protein
MIVIVDNVTATSEQGSEAVVKAAKGFERDIRELLRCAPYIFYSETIVRR